MLELKLIGISPDGDKHVAYLKIIDSETGKSLDNKTLPYITDAKFNTAAKKYFADFKEGYEVKKNIENKLQAKIDAINKAGGV